METISLLWTIVSIVVTTIVTVLGSVAGAAWWLKGQLISAELAGVRSENAALTQWRQFSDAQANKLAEELAAVRADNDILRKQVVEGADKKALVESTATLSRSINVAATTASQLVRGELFTSTSTFHPPEVRTATKIFEVYDPSKPPTK
jgi:hypothetical protein